MSKRNGRINLVCSKRTVVGQVGLIMPFEGSDPLLVRRPDNYRDAPLPNPNVSNTFMMTGFLRQFVQ
jgi:hypothetical protein